MDAKRQFDETFKSSDIMEPMKLPAKSSYAYQIMDHSQHTLKKYVSNEKKTCDY